MRMLTCIIIKSTKGRVHPKGMTYIYQVHKVDGIILKG